MMLRGVRIETVSASIGVGHLSTQMIQIDLPLSPKSVANRCYSPDRPDRENRDKEHANQNDLPIGTVKHVITKNRISAIMSQIDSQVRRSKGSPVLRGHEKHYKNN